MSVSTYNVTLSNPYMVSFPDYAGGMAPMFDAISNTLDSFILSTFAGQSLVLRCLRMADHPDLANVAALISAIETAGHDHYNPSRVDAYAAAFPPPSGYVWLCGAGVTVTSGGAYSDHSADATVNALNRNRCWWNQIKEETGDAMLFDVVEVFDQSAMTAVTSLAPITWQIPQTGSTALLALLTIVRP